MALAEIGKARQQPAYRECGQGIDAEQLALSPVTGIVGRSGDALEGRRDLGEIGLAQLRQHHAAVMPEKQRRADPVFQQADMAADRAVGDACLYRRCLQAAQPRRKLEGAKCIERRHSLLHR
jgi:hypothetical protein